jgi:RNA-binding protein Luc7-like 2
MYTLQTHALASSRQDHLNGKQYLGWKAIREHYAKLQEKFAPPPSSLPKESAPALVEEGEQPPSRERARSPWWVSREGGEGSPGRGP